MTASKCRTTHRKTLFRFHEDDPVLHDHKPNETSKAQSRMSIRSAAATAVEAADSRRARVVRPGPLLMPQQYVLSATPIVHSGLLEMRGSRARSTAAPGSTRRWEPSGCAGARPGRHNVTTTWEAREPIRWAESACKKALACSRRGRDRSAARSMEDTDLLCRVKSRFTSFPGVGRHQRDEDRGLCVDEAGEKRPFLAGKTCCARCRSLAGLVPWRSSTFGPCLSPC
jgi:hypothetical protein